MAEMTDAILKEAARVLERHPDLTPAFKTRLLLGLAERDRELQGWRQPVPVSDLAEPAGPAKRGRR